MQVVFITGSGGFTGSALLEYLRGHGYEVFAGVRNRARKLAYERKGIRSLVCDVTDPITVARAVASVRPDAVVHLAGVSNPTAAAREPLEAYQSIVTSWANVLDAVRRAVPRAKVLMASTCEVYGQSGSDGRAIPESTPLAPVSTFGSLKATAESVAHTFYRDYRLNVTIVRPFHYTGQGQPGHFFFAAVARRLAQRGSETYRLELQLPDLSCRRDVLHIGDVLTAYERLLQDGRPNEAYNICSGEAPTVRELVEAMASQAGVEVGLTELPGEAEGVRVPVLRGDPSKLRQELSWSPARTSVEAVRDLMAGSPAELAEAAV